MGKRKRVYHVISRKELDILIENGHVRFDSETNTYEFHEGMPEHLPISSVEMKDDILGHDRREFRYALDLENNEDPFIDGISGEFGKWFVPAWCVVEWLEKEGLL